MGKLSLGSADVVGVRAWYKKTFARAGTLESWLWETVNGKDYTTRKPHFNGFLAVTARLGATDARLVELALRHGRAVLGYNDNRELLVVTSLMERYDDETSEVSWAFRGHKMQGRNHG